MATENRLFYDRGGYIQVRRGSGGPELVPYPVCLAIRHADDLPETCPDFSMNAEESPGKEGGL